MKKTFLLPAVAALAAAFLLGACGWDGSGKDDSWSDTPINVSGSYHGTAGYGGQVVKNLSGKPITYLSVQQQGTAVSITDNAGGKYAGKISSTHKTAKGSGSSAVIQYALNFEVSGNDYQGQRTRLVGTFEAVAEGNRLHDRVISGSWLGSSKNGTIYGLAASVVESQLGASGIAGSDVTATNSSSSSSSSTNSSSSYSTNTMRWVNYIGFNPDDHSNDQEIKFVAERNKTYSLEIDGGSGKYRWKREPWKESTAVGSLENGSASSKKRIFHAGTKTGTAKITVTDQNTNRKIVAYITVY